MSLRGGIAGQALRAVVYGPDGGPANGHGLPDLGPVAVTAFTNVTTGLRDGRGDTHAAAQRRLD
ncbi:MAG: hypothetical protein WCP35_09735 [Verrucomicrobiota bacterium]